MQQRSIRLRVAELAQARGMNQTDLAHRTGLTMNVVGRYWRDEVANLSRQSLEKLALALNVSARDLIEDDMSRQASLQEQQEETQAPGLTPALA